MTSCRRLQSESRLREDTGGKEQPLLVAGRRTSQLRKSSHGRFFRVGRDTWRVARMHRPVTVAAHIDLSHRHEPFAAQRRQHHQAARLSARPCFPTRMTRTSASKGANTIHMKLYARSVGTSFDEQRSCFAMSRFHGEVQWSVPFFSIAC